MDLLYCNNWQWPRRLPTKISMTFAASDAFFESGGSMAITEPLDPRVENQPVPAAVDRAVPPAVVREASAPGASGAETLRRVAVLLFGLIQITIILRVVLLLVDAREGNGLVSGILNISQVFVAPFDGILHTNALSTGGSILDLAAIVALVGWTVLELIVIWGIGVFRREAV
jgi:hypothetical protein